MLVLIDQYEFIIKFTIQNKSHRSVKYASFHILDYKFIQI